MIFILSFAVRFKKAHLVCHNFPSHFSEEIGSTASPPMLLMTVGLEGTWEFTLDLCKFCTCNDVGHNIIQYSACSMKNNYLELQTAKHTLISPTYKNSHSLRHARTARSMSSTVVRSFHPPDSLIADTRHTPAVPVDKKEFLLIT